MIPNPVPSVFSSCHTKDVSNLDRTRRRPGKVRGSNLPQEYELSQFVANIENPYPSWNTSTPACEWKGAWCDTEQKVRYINWHSFIGQQLRGSLQWNYFVFTLHEFRAPYNKLTGNVRLDMLPSKFVEFSIPSNLFTGGLELCDLPESLEEVQLYRNDFQGSIDMSCLGKNIRTLKVSRNDLSGEIDFTSLPSCIDFISLSHNRFTGPLNLQHLPSSLRYLKCGHNLFSGLVEFHSLPPGLEIISLRDNSALYGDVNDSDLPGTLYSIKVDGTNIMAKNLN